MPPPPDPIAPIVQALTVLVAPNPALVQNPAQPATTWTGNLSGGTDGTLFTPIQTVLSLLFGLSSDLTSVGNFMNTAVTDVGSAISGIAGEVATIGAVQADVISAFTAVQTLLGLAEMFAPTSANNVLTSASGLFKQLQALLSNVPDLATAADELGQLAQQLTTAAPLFPA